jgi:beta-glucosidase-like glycosyl hydrolase/CubicO group peptidase (beta-lactamase class C family)
MFCYAQTVPTLYQAANQKQMNQWVDSVFNKLSLEEQIGQLFMVIATPSTNAANTKLLTRYINELKLGGVLFHKGNPITQAQITNRMQGQSKTPLMISLDGEWGLSMRLSNTTRFPKNMMLGAIENDLLIYKYAQEVGRQCKEMGIHINFAPSMDVNSNVNNPVIGLRSFGEDVHAVTNKSLIYSKGLEQKGILSVAKHFPGHGDTSTDSHYTLPTILHDRARLDSVELYPFVKYINQGYAGIMTAHLSIPALDKSRKPSSLSKPIITDLLQKELGFRGLCFTDALAMKGAADKNNNISVQALLAGNDVLLAPATPFTDFKAIKEGVASGMISKELIAEKCKKVLAYKYIAGLNNYKPIQIEGLSKRLNTPHAAWLASKLNEEALTLLKNKDNIIPIKGLDKKKIAVLSVGGKRGNDFETTLSQYANVTNFQLSRNATAAQINKLYSQLAQYDLIICGMFTARIPESPALRRLATDKKFIYVFFTLPYYLKSHKASANQAEGIVIGYEATPLAQQLSAQLLFGGIEAKGKLPVTIPTLYYAGSGIFTQKARLSFQEPQEVELDPVRLSEIDNIVNEGLEAKAFPGCQVLVAKDGAIVYNKSFGNYTFDTKAPAITNQSVFDLASATKAAATLPAFMKIYDEEKLTLSSSVGELLPAYKESDKSDIKMKALLYHQSGITPTINFYMHAVDKYSYKGSVYSRKRDALHTVKYDANTYVNNKFKFLKGITSPVPTPSHSIEAARHLYIANSFKDTITDQIKKSKLGKPNSYRYSCINFILLQHIIEKVEDKPLDKVLYDSFYKRLGATTTTFTPLHYMDTTIIVPSEEDQFIRKQRLQGYVHDESAAFQGGISGNAGLFSNATDLAKMLQLFLNEGTYGGEQYISKKTTKLFTQSKSPTCRRGLGFDKPSGKEGLASMATYGHTGYTGTCFWVDPEQQLIYIFLSNRVYPNRSNTKLAKMNIRTRIQDLIYKSITKT